MPRRRLIVNADDFGLTRGVNEGIIEARTRGILRSATLMANGPAFDHAAALAREHQELDVGCHLMLVRGAALTLPGGKLPDSVPQLLGRLATSLAADLIEQEFAAQIDKLHQAGIEPTHLDTHKHTHLAPPVLKALLRVARRFDIPWVRRPFDLPLTAARGAGSPRTRAVQWCLRPLARRFARSIERHGCRATDHFAGFQMTGAFEARQLIALIRELPDGLTEFMCHPGRVTDDLRRLPTRLRESREQELRALTDPRVWEAAERAGVELASFREA